MQCRSCGTEIADKAIVCYRCGAATTDPVRRPVPLKPRGGLLAPIVLVAVLLLLAAYLGYAAQTTARPDIVKLGAGLCAGGAAAILFLRVLRRR